MGRETSKARARRIRDGTFYRYLTGRGLDIGCGDDPITPDCLQWDLPQGDAATLPGLEPESFDWVYSSHCLEDLPDPQAALRRWWEVLKPGGCLLLAVPDEDLYEQGVWPSRFNAGHRWSFTAHKSRSWCPASRNLLDLVRELPAHELLHLRRCDDRYEYSAEVWDRTQGVAEAALEVLVRKGECGSPGGWMGRSTPQLRHVWDGHFDPYLRGSGLNLSAGADASRSHGLGGKSQHAEADRPLGVEPGSLDWLCSTQPLDDLAEPGPALAGWWEALKPGGYLLLAVPDAEPEWENGHLRTSGTWSSEAVHLMNLVSDLPPHERVHLRRREGGYAYQETESDATAAVARASVEVLVRKVAQGIQTFGPSGVQGAAEGSGGEGVQAFGHSGVQGPGEGSGFGGQGSGVHSSAFAVRSSHAGVPGFGSISPSGSRPSFAPFAPSAPFASNAGLSFETPLAPGAVVTDAPLRIYTGILGQIGDIVMATAAVRRIKELYPHSVLTFAVSRKYREAGELVAGLPYVDRLFVTEEYFERLTPELSGPWELGWPADLRGEDEVEEQRRHDLIFETRPRHRRMPWWEYAHQVEETAHMLRVPGPISRRTEVAIPPGTEIPPEWRGRIAVHNDPDTDARKAWPWEALQRLAAEVGPERIALLGQQGPPLPGVLDLRGRTTLAQAAAVIRDSRCYLGVDSGLMWIAGSLGVPAVGLYGREYIQNPKAVQPANPRAVYLEAASVAEITPAAVSDTLRACVD